MAMSPADVLKQIKDKEVKFVDFRFTDTRGKEQHVSVPAKQFTMEKVRRMVTLSTAHRSPAGRALRPPTCCSCPKPIPRAWIPFTDETVLNITCDVVEPSDGKGYDRDPRSIAKRAEAYLKSTGLGRHRLLRSRSPSSSFSIR